MAVDMFLKIDGVAGESIDKAHTDWIDVLSWSWGESLPGAKMLTGAASPSPGKVSMSSFTIVKYLDKASPLLMLACMQGKVFPKVEIQITRTFEGAGAPTETTVAFLKLTNALVSSLRLTDAEASGHALPQGANPASLPLEVLTLNYTKIIWTYQQTDALGGAVGSPLSAGWDLRVNRKG